MNKKCGGTEFYLHPPAQDYRVITELPMACCLQGVQRQEPQEQEAQAAQLPPQRICIPSLTLPLIRSKTAFDGIMAVIFYHLLFAKLIVKEQ